MRISIVIDSGTAGGAEWQAVALTRALVGSGADAELLVLGSGDDYRADIEAHAVPVTQLHAAGLARLGAARAALRARRPDVVHVVKSPGIVGRAAARAAGVPVILGGRRGFARPSAKNRLLDRLLRPSTAGWVVNAARLKGFVEAEGVPAGRVYHVPNVVYPVDRPLTSRDETRRAHGLPADRPLCLLVASVRPVKNHPFALRVAARLSGDAAGPVVAFVGSRTDSAEMRDAVGAAGLANTVHLLGHSDDVPSLLAAGDVALLTSRTEGLPNALLEAGLAGLPSVSTDCGGASEVVVDGETGYIVGVDDDAAMAERIARLAGDDALRRRMGEAARRRVLEHHAPDRVAALALAAYRDACARAGHEPG